LLFLFASGDVFDFDNLNERDSDRNDLADVVFVALLELIRRDLATLIDLPYLFLGKHFHLIVSLSEISLPLSYYQMSLWMNLARMFEKISLTMLQSDLERTVVTLLARPSTKAVKSKSIVELGLKFLVKAFCPLSKLAIETDVKEFDKFPAVSKELKRLTALHRTDSFGAVIEI